MRCVGHIISTWRLCRCAHLRHGRGLATLAGLSWRSRTPAATYATSSSNASESTSNPYPYPLNPNPNPYQIFHLPRGASHSQVKSRYYDLVRIYHPDSPIARLLPPEVSQSRFQAITRAYDVLRGKNPATGETLVQKTAHHLRAEVWRGSSPRRPHLDDTSHDERWKERAMVVALLVTLVAFVWQNAATRRQAIAEAMSRRGHNDKPSSDKDAGSDSNLSLEKA